MPVCNWCGIESKSDLVCDWCKRPLALSATRRPSGGRSAVDLLKDADDDQSGISKRAIQGVILAAFLVIIVMFWMLVSRPSETVATTNSPEFSAERESVTKGAGTTKSAAPPRPALMPREPSKLNVSTFFKMDESKANRGATLSAPLAWSIALESNEFAPIAGPAVRLTGGLLKNLGGRKGITVGMISVSNSTGSEIVDFRLEAVIDGRNFALQPFEGSLDSPRNLNARTVAPGEKLTVPVIAVGYNGGRKPAVVPARIVLNAWLASGPGVVKDELFSP